MNKEEFLNQLEKELAALSTHERCCALDFYDELISDGNENGADEQALIAGFGTPAEVAKQIIEDSQTVPAPAKPQEEEVHNEPEAENRAETGTENRYADSENADYTAHDSVSAIVIDASNTAVELRAVSSGFVRVHFNSTPHDRISVVEENGVFSFRHRIRYNPFTLDWLPVFGPRRIIVDVPADYSGTLSVKDSNAGLYASGLCGISRADFATSNAKIRLHDMSAAELDVQTCNASVDLQSLRGRRCEVKTSDGRITASDCAFKERLRLHTSNSPIRFWNCVCDNMEFVTSNARVSGGIVGDAREYAIKSHTSNASNNLPGDLSYPDQTKKLRIHTSNAKIDVRFEK